VLIGEYGKSYLGSILLGPWTFARASHSSLEPKLMGTHEHTLLGLALAAGFSRKRS
jgi:hypothetical protein